MIEPEVFDLYPLPVYDGETLIEITEYIAPLEPIPDPIQSEVK